MSKNKGNTTLIFLIIAVILLLPALFNKSTTTKEATIINKKEGTIVPAQVTTKTTEQKPAETKAVGGVSSTEQKPSQPAVDPNISIYKGKIDISYVYGTSDKAKDEKIVIINRSEEPISVTGFSLETYSLEKFIIPKAYNLPGFATSPSDNIVLAPGGGLYIYVGTQERRIDFRENICTGYFDEKSDFGGVLSHSCPIIDVSKMLNFSDACIRQLNNMPRCKLYESSSALDRDCNQFAMDHYSYANCVKDYKNQKDFYSNNWFVWMQRTTEFFRSGHELVKLKDVTGKIVTEYQY